MWDDDVHECINPDEDNWERFRNTRMNSMWRLVDLLTQLKVLGPGFDMSMGGPDITDQYVDRHWKA